MYGVGNHPAGNSPPTPASSGPGIIGPYAPPIKAPSLGHPTMPASAPETMYPLANVLPAQVGPTGRPAPRF